MTPRSRPWFVDHSEPLPFGAEGKLIVGEEAVGEIEIRSGRIRVTSKHGLTRGSRPLDLQVAPGRWEIRRFVDRSPEEYFAEGDLGVAVLRPGTELSDLNWSKATAGGLPAEADEILGDADLAMLLGNSPYADSFPRGYHSSRRPTEEEQRAFAAHPRLARGIGRLLPSSTVDAYAGRSAIRLPWYYRPGEQPVWSGTDATGSVVAVVVDHLAGLLGADALAAVEDIWRDSFPDSRGAELLEGANLEPESADLVQLPTLPHVHEVRLWHECEMRGQLFAVASQPAWLVHPDEMNVGERKVALPIRADGWVTAYALETTGDNALILRFGGASPTRWAHLSIPDIRDVLVTSESFLEEAHDDRNLRAAFADVSARSSTRLVENISAIPTWSTIDGGTPGTWVVGLDDEGRVVALLISDDPESSVYAARSPELDAPTLEALRGASANVEDREGLAEDLTYLEEQLAASDGVVTPEIRGFMHWMHQRHVG